ncbi:hypothetical protein P7B02_17560 [Caulobacter segnis]|uniref:hypothetical protein n=1 Tax=Caulobacter segnis TaxID=88688 RepID=UPI0024106245|nr:hypothetical protein [Caulobacter segnis]MDG2523340.1 hypothetical protein [Caulobacter segnis]
MLFLLNDVVLSLDAADLAPPLSVAQLGALNLHAISRLGQELFSEEPLLQRKAVERAHRLAALIVYKQPEVNAALFVALARGVPHDEVAVRYASLGVEMMAGLYARQKAGVLTNIDADKAVWQRFAA